MQQSEVTFRVNYTVVKVFFSFKFLSFDYMYKIFQENLKLVEYMSLKVHKNGYHKGKSVKSYSHLISLLAHMGPYSKITINR